MLRPVFPSTSSMRTKSASHGFCNLESVKSLKRQLEAVELEESSALYPLSRIGTYRGMRCVIER